MKGIGNREQGREQRAEGARISQKPEFIYYNQQLTTLHYSLFPVPFNNNQ